VLPVLLFPCTLPAVAVCSIFSLNACVPLLSSFSSVPFANHSDVHFLIFA